MGGFEGYCLTFTNNGFFEYSFYTCTGESYGKGFYKLNKKQLLLHFDDSKETKKGKLLTSYFKEELIKCNLQDSVELTLELMDRQNKEIIPFATIGLGKTHGDKFKVYATTNIDGLAILKVPKSENEIDINARYVGYSPFTFKLKPNSCKKVQIYLKVGDSYLIPQGAIWQFEIKECDSTHLILRKYTKEDYKELIKSKE